MSSRWKKGQSGNPKGRPRKTKPPELDVGAHLTNLLAQELTVKRGDRVMRASMLEAGLLQLVTGFANGERSARRDLLQFVDKYGIDLGGASARALTPDSKRLFDEFVESLAGPDATVREQASEDLLDDDAPGDDRPLGGGR